MATFKNRLPVVAPFLSQRYLQQVLSNPTYKDRKVVAPFLSQRYLQPAKAAFDQFEALSCCPLSIAKVFTTFKMNKSPLATSVVAPFLSQRYLQHSLKKPNAITIFVVAPFLSQRYLQLR